MRVHGNAECGRICERLWLHPEQRYNYHRWSIFRRHATQWWQFKGSGRLYGNLTVTGGTINPGNSPGLFTVEGNVTWASARR